MYRHDAGGVGGFWGFDEWSGEIGVVGLIVDAWWFRFRTGMVAVDV